MGFFSATDGTRFVPPGLGVVASQSFSRTPTLPIDMIGWRTAALLPKAQYKESGNAAHGLYLTHADRLNADLLAFIKS